MNFTVEICELCKESQATCHFVALPDDSPRFSFLCWECYQIQVTKAMESREAFARTHCHYCSGMIPAGDTGVGTYSHFQSGLMCKACSTEHGQFINTGMAQIPQDLPQCEELNEVAALLNRADKHMREWVAERKSRQINSTAQLVFKAD